MSGVLRALLLIGLLASDAGAAAASPGYSADTLYNAANAYARAGKTGMAVLSYERAELLAPDDPDIEANLGAVRAAARLPAAPPSRFARTVTVAGPAAMAWLGIAGVLIVGALALAVRIGRCRRWPAVVGALAGIALIALTLCNAAVMWPRLQMGVVVVAAAPARVAPVPLGDPLFVLKEAETVSLSAAHEGYVLVHTATGQAGWVSQTDVAAVVPRNGS